ncbi:MAG: hypothetical protein M3Q63_01845 [bacterium]|nr:hypothetical protein [bacterium]
MSVWLTTFVLSGSGIVLLLLLKVVQDKFNILLFWPESRHHVEVSLIKRKRMMGQYVGWLNIKNFYIILHFVITKLKKVLIRIYKLLDRRSNRLISLIRGKQYIESKNKSSYFLHDIASIKDRFRK